MKLEQHWYRSSLTWLTVLLLPLSWLFRLIVAIRFFLYRAGFKKTYSFNVPIIVVGNMTVGGTGKTPFVIWLAAMLQRHGYHPGIVSRGVGGKALLTPHWVDQHADPSQVGDEAVLLAKRTQCPMVACINRVAAVKELLTKTDCNVIISDDGLQHYRLGRCFEVIIVDGTRQFGNQQMLPAGPLREPLKRMQQTNLIVTNTSTLISSSLPFYAGGGGREGKVVKMNLKGTQCQSLSAPTQQRSLATFQHQKVHAIAGIGNPQRFFTMLRDHQIDVIEHTFPDHYLYQQSDIYFNDHLPVLMTEKDAVKCIKFADDRHWYLPVVAEISDGVEEAIISKIRQ